MKGLAKRQQLIIMSVSNELTVEGRTRQGVVDVSLQRVGDEL